MHTTSSTRRSHFYHQYLATLWICYNGRRAWATPAQVGQVQDTLSVSALERMLGAVGVKFDG